MKNVRALGTVISEDSTSSSGKIPPVFDPAKPLISAAISCRAHSTHIVERKHTQLIENNQSQYAPLDTIRDLSAHPKSARSAPANGSKFLSHPAPPLRLSRTSMFRARIYGVAALALSIALTGTAASAQSAATKPLTVERIYSSPSLSGELTQGIEWAPDGKRISYLQKMGDASELVDHGCVHWRAQSAGESGNAGRRDAAGKNAGGAGDWAGPHPAGQLSLVARRRFSFVYWRQQPGVARSEDHGSEADRHGRYRPGRPEVLSRRKMDQLSCATRISGS